MDYAIRNHTEKRKGRLYMNQKTKGTVMLVCGIVCLVSSLILIVLRCVTGEAYVKNKDVFMCLVWIALGVYFCYQGWKAKKDG